MTEDDAAAGFGALANTTRLRILKLLVAAGPTGVAAGEVARAIGAAPSRASFHLSTLADTGLIAAEREARRLIYRANFAMLGGLLAYMLEDCCANHPTVRSCCA